MDDSEIGKDILDRLARLETKVTLKFEEIERSLGFIRDIIRSEGCNAKSLMQNRDQCVSELKQKTDSIINTCVTKDEHKELSRMINTNSKMIYIGIGGVLVVEFIIKYMK